MDLIKEWWIGFNFRGSPSFVLHSKLKALKQNLKAWNQDVFGNAGIRRSELLDELAILDGLDERVIIDEVGRVRRLEITRELDDLIFMEETSWRQKSRAL